MEKILVVSTAHLPQLVIDLLREQPGNYPLRTLNDEFGAILALPTAESWPDTTDELLSRSDMGRCGGFALVRAMAIAVEAGATYLSLDRDGSRLEELRLFEW